tara:strand:- start:1345 stop:1545 length:201 start_codon:yes stop_codon:yes gene_type:complete
MKVNPRTQRNIVFVVFLAILGFVFFPLFNSSVGNSDVNVIAVPSNGKIEIGQTVQNTKSQENISEK